MLFLKPLLIFLCLSWILVLGGFITAPYFTFSFLACIIMVPQLEADVEKLKRISGFAQFGNRFLVWKMLSSFHFIFLFSENNFCFLFFLFLKM